MPPEPTGSCLATRYVEDGKANSARNKNPSRLLMQIPLSYKVRIKRNSSAFSPPTRRIRARKPPSSCKWCRVSPCSTGEKCGSGPFSTPPLPEKSTTRSPIRPICSTGRPAYRAYAAYKQMHADRHCIRDPPPLRGLLQYQYRAIAVAISLRQRPAVRFPFEPRFSPFLPCFRQKHEPRIPHISGFPEHSPRRRAGRGFSPRLTNPAPAPRLPAGTELCPVTTFPVAHPFPVRVIVYSQKRGHHGTALYPSISYYLSSIAASDALDRATNPKNPAIPPRRASSSSSPFARPRAMPNCSPATPNSSSAITTPPPPPPTAKPPTPGKPTPKLPMPPAARRAVLLDLIAGDRNPPKPTSLPTIASAAPTCSSPCPRCSRRGARQTVRDPRPPALLRPHGRLLGRCPPGRRASGARPQRGHQRLSGVAQQRQLWRNRIS